MQGLFTVYHLESILAELGRCGQGFLSWARPKTLKWAWEHFKSMDSRMTDRSCVFIMYLCLYHPENGRDTDNVIKWTLSPCY